MPSFHSFVALISRKFHLWAGIVFAPLLIMLAITGIGLNHPDWIRSVSFPVDVLPENYQYHNWNRGLVSAIISDEKGGYFATGKEGVWHFIDNEAKRLDNPYQDSAWKKMGYSLYLDSNTHHLLSGTREGIYSLNLVSNEWKTISGSPREQFVSIINGADGLLAISRKGLYHLKFHEQGYQLQPIPIELADNGQSSPLYRLIFQLHSGELLGKVGIFIMDAAAGLLIFLSVSGLYMFVFPRLVKRKLLSREGRISGGRKFRWMLKHHNHWGLVIAIVLLISGATGLLMRPPGLLLVSNVQSPIKIKDLHFSPLPHSIGKALWDPKQNALMLLTSGGLYREAPEMKNLFVPADLPVPISGMGANVFQHYKSSFIIGSFKGLFHWDPASERVSPVTSETWPRRVMPTALLENEGDMALFDFSKGLRLSQNSQLSIPQMPDDINHQASISLWHLFFELHNLRFFRFILGPSYLLLLALTGLMLVLISITGIYDYFKKRR